eukprot:1054418_1
MSASSIVHIDALIAHFASPTEKILQDCFSDYPLQSIRYIRNFILDGHIVPCQSLIDSAIVPHIIQLLQHNNYTFEMLLSGYIRESTLEYIVPKDIITTIDNLCVIHGIDDSLQLEGRHVLASIAATEFPYYSTYIVNHGAIPPLMHGLDKHQSISVQTVSIRALGNIIACDRTQRDILFKQIIKCIVKLMRHHKLNKMNNEEEEELSNVIAYAVLNLTIHEHNPRWKYTKKMLYILSALLKCTNHNHQTLQDVCGAFRLLINSKRNSSRLHEFFATHVTTVEKLVKLLDHDCDAVRHTSLVTISTLCTGAYQHTQDVVKCGALKKLAFILKNDAQCGKRVKVACLLISTITSDSQTNVKAMLRANLMPELLNLLKHKQKATAVAALCTISNAASKLNETEIDEIMKRGGLQSVCNFLIYPQMNGVLMKALIITKRMLIRKEYTEYFEECGGLDSLKALIITKRMLIRKEYTEYFEECGGLDSLKALRSNQWVSKKIYDKIDTIIRIFCRLQCD